MTTTEIERKRRIVITLDDGSVAHATMNGKGPDSPATLAALKEIAEAAAAKFGRAGGGDN